MKYKVMIEKRQKNSDFYRYKITVESETNKQTYFCSNFPKLCARLMIKGIEKKKRKIESVTEYEVEV